MRYYTLPRLGTGTADDPYRSDVPAGTSWVGTVGSDGAYLIATSAPLPSKSGRTERPDVDELRAAATQRGLRYEDVKTWRVGEP